MSVRPIKRRPARAPGRRHLSRRSLLGGAAATGLLVPTAGLLNACASGGDDDPQEGEMTDENPFGFVPDSQVDAVFFTGGFGTEYPDAIKELFEARWDQAQVAVTGTTTIATQIQPRFAGGSPPDFLNNSGEDSIPIDALVNDGALHPLTDLMNAPSLDDPSKTVRDTLVPGVVEQGSFGGTMYELNYSNTVYGMWYDAKLFRDNNWTPPTTWSEFLALADQIKAAGIAPFILGMQNSQWYAQNVIMEWANLEGGAEAMIAIDNLEPGAWRHPAVVTAAQRLQELVDADLIYPGSEGLNHIQAQQLWLDREAAFLWCGTWIEGEMSDEETLAEEDAAGIPDDFEITLIAPWAPSDNPALPAGSARNAPGEGFVIPAQGNNVAGGLEMMRTMLTKDAGDRFAEITNSFTVVAGTGLNNESGALRSAGEVIANSPENLLWRWEGWYNRVMYEETMQPLLGEIWAGRASADDLLDAMEDAAQQVRDDPEIEKFTREA